jgi:hypothetical protein
VPATRWHSPFIDQLADLRDGPVEIVVHDDGIREGPPDGFLFERLAHTFFDLALRVAAAPEAANLLVTRRCHDEHDESVGMAGPYLAGTVELDLEHDIASFGWHGRGSAVEVAEEVGPFEKPAVGDALFKVLAGREYVGLVGLTRTLSARRPRAA